MSPHNADRTSDFQFSAMALFLEQAQRWIAGQPLMDPVEKTAGY